jgi:DNA polymerase elongation subunit (family B)
MLEPLLIVDIAPVSEGNRWYTAIRGKTLKGETKILKVYGCKPKFWTARDKSELPDWSLLPAVKSVKYCDKTTIQGEPLMEVTVHTPWNIREVRDFFYPHYSADVHWSSLVRWIYGWRAVIEVDTEKDWNNLRPVNIHDSKVEANEFNLDLFYFDIETEDCLDTETPEGRVVSIAFYDEKSGIHEVGTIAPTSERLVVSFLTQKETLESVVEMTADTIPPIDSDKVKVTNFDYADLDEAEEKLLCWWHDKLNEYNPDVIAGQNIKHYDIPYLINRSKICQKNGWKTPDLRYMKNLPFFDTKIAYAEQVQGAAATTGAASLSWMAMNTLGYGKVPSNRITDLMEKDPMMLAVYNIWDNVVAARCMEKLDLLPFYIMKTAYHNSTLHKSHSNMMLVEDMMAHLLWDENIIMPSAKVVADNMPEGGIEQGGFVMEAPVGVWRNAFELDNSMEYPSAIITGNFGPDTKVNPADYPDGYPFPVTITKGGRVYRRDKESIMATVLRNLASARQSLKDQMKTEKDSERLMVLDRQQRVMKENMNSWYGVLGSGRTEKTKNRPFRLADPDIGSDITETAREHNDWNKRYINERTLWFCDEGVYIEKDYIPPSLMAMELRFGTLYQDTDSCKVAILNHDEVEAAIRPFTEEDVIDMANILCKELNESFDDFVKECLNVDKNEFFNIKPDAYYKRYFQWGVKKRYAYLDYNNKKGYRGVEMRRSSTPQIVKDIQQAMFEEILNGAGRVEIGQLLRDMVDDLLNPDITPSMNFGQPFGVKKKGTFAHKAAMWSNENLGTEFDLGDKPCIYFVKSAEKPIPNNRRIAIEWGDNPDDYNVVIDREMTIQTMFAESNSFRKILAALGTNWERCMSGVGVSSMGEWFQ